MRGNEGFFNRRITIGLYSVKGGYTSNHGAQLTHHCDFGTMEANSARELAELLRLVVMDDTLEDDDCLICETGQLYICTVQISIEPVRDLDPKTFERRLELAFSHLLGQEHDYEVDLDRNQDPCPPANPDDHRHN